MGVGGNPSIYDSMPTLFIPLIITLFCCLYTGKHKLDTELGQECVSDTIHTKVILL